MDLTQLLDKKITEAENEFDRMEFTTIKCLFKNKYDDLLKLFGFDSNKIVGEVEKYLGKKLKSNIE